MSNEVRRWRFGRDDRGAAMVEYALLFAAMGIAVSVGVALLSSRLSVIYSFIGL